MSEWNKIKWKEERRSHGTLSKQQEGIIRCGKHQIPKELFPLTGAVQHANSPSALLASLVIKYATAGSWLCIGEDRGILFRLSPTRAR